MKSSVMNSTARFAAAAVLIAAAAVFLQARTRGEVFPPRQPLKLFPEEITTQSGAVQKEWTSIDIPMDKDVLEILGPGDFLLRVYQEQQSQSAQKEGPSNQAQENSPEPQPYIDLFIAYFRSQRAGDTIHSPQHCLPGAGWVPVENTPVTLSVPGHAPFPVNRYVIARGDSKQLVLYWFWAHDRGVASEYWAKFYLVTDSIKTNRSDGSLVRITTPMLPGESPDAAEQRLMPFVDQVVPQLNNYIPR
jgi:EpsI family protein